MKNGNVFILVIFLLVFSQLVYAQEEHEEIELPEAPEFEFNFQEFHSMSEKDEQELLKNIKKELREELKTLKDLNKNKYFEFLRESQFQNMKIPFMAKRDKIIHEREIKIFEAEVKTEYLAAKYGKANESDKKNIKLQLRQQLGQLFEQKEQRRKEEVEQLANELKELKKSLAIREKNKKDIIERRVRELLDEDQYLDWD